MITSIAILPILIQKSFLHDRFRFWLKTLTFSLFLSTFRIKSFNLFSFFCSRSGHLRFCGCGHTTCINLWWNTFGIIMMMFWCQIKILLISTHFGYLFLAWVCVLCSHTPIFSCFQTSCYFYQLFQCHVTFFTEASFPVVEIQNNTSETLNSIIVLLSMSIKIQF